MAVDLTSRGTGESPGMEGRGAAPPATLLMQATSACLQVQGNASRERRARVNKVTAGEDSG